LKSFGFGREFSIVLSRQDGGNFLEIIYKAGIRAFFFIVSRKDTKDTRKK